MFLSTDAPDTLISNIDGRKSFNAAGVKFQLLEAMRRWRILFNGTAVRTRVDGEVIETDPRKKNTKESNKQYIYHFSIECPDS